MYKQQVSRRTFLHASSTVLAGAALSNALSTPVDAGENRGGNKTPWSLRLSTSTVQFSSLSVEKACARIAALGFAAVDFWHAGFGCPHLDEIEKRLGPEGLKDLLAKNHLKLYAFTCYNVGPNAGYPRFAEILGKAGGGVAVREARYGKIQDLTAEMKALLEQLKPQLELAEKYNSRIAIENHADSLLNSKDSFKAFVELNRNHRLGIALAPYHLQAAGISVEEVIGIAGKQLLFFYAWQHAEGMKQLPGVGPADFTPWIAALARTGYPEYVNPFMHGHPGPDEMASGLETARTYLIQCYRKGLATS
ncbi:MAG: sugar phosphate isomerase/epimerase [Thermoguttaceae bacterium]|jgi:sugar phosphate isomerase/epimerase